MKKYRFIFPDGFEYVVSSSEGIRQAKESALRDYGLWARRGRDHYKATDLFRALDSHKDGYRFEECDTSTPEGSNGKIKRTVSPETRRKISETMKNQTSWNKGLQWNEAQRSKLTGRKRSAASRKKMAEKATGQVPWNRGLSTPDEVKKKLRDSQVGKWKWATDGVRSVCLRMEDEIPQGWKRGRTYRTSFLEIW